MLQQRVAIQHVRGLPCPNLDLIPNGKSLPLQIPLRMLDLRAGFPAPIKREFGAQNRKLCFCAGCLRACLFLKARQAPQARNNPLYKYIRMNTRAQRHIYIYTPMCMCVCVFVRARACLFLNLALAPSSTAQLRKRPTTFKKNTKFKFPKTGFAVNLAGLSMSKPQRGCFFATRQLLNCGGGVDKLIASAGQI